MFALCPSSALPWQACQSLSEGRLRKELFVKEKTFIKAKSLRYVIVIAPFYTRVIVDGAILLISFCEGEARVFMPRFSLGKAPVIPKSD